MSSDEPGGMKLKQDSPVKCPNCGYPSRANFCPNCGEQLQSQKTAPRGKPKRRSQTMLWIVLAVLALFYILGSIGEREANTGANISPSLIAATATTSTLTSTPVSTQPPQPTMYYESDSFRESVISVIAYHESIAQGDASEAESAGKMTAFKMNLGMHKMTGTENLEYRVYFYALYGKAGYLSEFGDDKLLPAVEAYFADLLGEDGWIEAVSLVAANQANAEKQAAIDKAEYIKSAETVSYDKLVRNPDDYKGKILKVTVKITQIMGEGSWLFRSAYHGYEGSSSNEWYIAFDLPEGSSRIIEGDRVVFYGEFTGLESVTRALTLTTELVPSLAAEYFVMK